MFSEIICVENAEYGKSGVCVLVEKHKKKPGKMLLSLSSWYFHIYTDMYINVYIIHFTRFQLFELNSVVFSWAEMERLEAVLFFFRYGICDKIVASSIDAWTKRIAQ